MPNWKDMMTSHGMAKAGLQAGVDAHIASISRGLEASREQHLIRAENARCRELARTIAVQAILDGYDDQDMAPRAPTSWSPGEGDTIGPWRAAMSKWAEAIADALLAKYWPVDSPPKVEP